jgi:hypothetical protein
MGCSLVWRAFDPPRIRFSPARKSIETIMRTFTCDSCNGTLYFENDTCLTCGQKVGFRPDEMAMCTIAAARAAGMRECRNWSEYRACNWFAAVSPGRSGYCMACDLNEVVPDLRDPQRRALWTETEGAKRRLIFTLRQLKLPLFGLGAKQALRFRLLADERVNTGAVDPPKQEPIHMGHEGGRLTLDVGEADDARREAVRKRMHEPYRTMLGHLRHEIGHYYWYVLVDGAPLQPMFRALFGDERKSYEAALKNHYESAPPSTWQQSFVSAYASAHPWEDFAETWAHYIHILDTLDTASAAMIAIGGRAIVSPLPLVAERPFATILDAWRPLSVCLNQLNRSMGMRDAYPFAATNRVIEKLGFIHEICLRAILDDAMRGA